jgi:hypothetical protein
MRLGLSLATFARTLQLMSERCPRARPGGTLVALRSGSWADAARPREALGTGPRFLRYSSTGPFSGLGPTGERTILSAVAIRNSCFYLGAFHSRDLSWLDAAVPSLKQDRASVALKR